MPKRTLNAKDILRDVRNGATDEELMAKHGMSVNELDVVFKNLVGADILTASDLVDAAKAGAARRVRTLLRCGLEVNSADADGCTALHWAAAHDHSEVVRLLLEHGADVNKRDSEGRTPLAGILAASKVEIGFRNPDAGDFETFAKVTDGDGRIRMFNEPAYGHLGVIETLLAAGANVNAADRQGRTPLMEAALNGHAKAITLFLSKGAQVNRRDGGGETPLMKAAFAGQARAAKLLLKHGARVNAVNRAGLTPLMMIGFEEGHVETVRVLADYGAATDARDPQGRTALMHAAAWGRPAVVRLLLDRGADARITDEEGLTALEIAEEMDEPEVVEILKDHAERRVYGANPTGPRLRYLYHLLCPYCAREEVEVHPLDSDFNVAVCEGCGQKFASVLAISLAGRISVFLQANEINYKYDYNGRGFVPTWG